MPVEEKEKASFGAIVATIGAVLIALGIAWLIALNWAAMPSPLKILILVFLTVAAYAGAVMFRMYDYQRIGQSLLILGALLYTLSVFLIAQIFSTSASTQGVAWLWLLALAGVVLAGFAFSNAALLGIAVAEFVLWIWYQSIAFTIPAYSNGMDSFLIIPLFAVNNILAAL